PCRPKPFQGLRTSEGFAKCKTLRKASRALPAMLDEQTTMTDLVYRHLISDLKLIDTLITQFELVHTDNDKWTKTYLDKAKNDNWLSYYVDGAQHGGGQKILGRLPLPSTEKLIDIAIHSESEDEVFAACRTMTDNEELRKQDFRLALIDNLETILDKDRQGKIIELTGLTSSLNRRDVLGKTSEQIEADAYYYKQISDRADKLKRK